MIVAWVVMNAVIIHFFPSYNSGNQSRSSVTLHTFAREVDKFRYRISQRLGFSGIGNIMGFIVILLSTVDNSSILHILLQYLFQISLCIY